MRKVWEWLKALPDKIENYEEVELPKEETSEGEEPTPENSESENEG